MDEVKSLPRKLGRPMRKTPGGCFGPCTDFTVSRLGLRFKARKDASPGCSDWQKQGLTVKLNAR